MSIKKIETEWSEPTFEEFVTQVADDTFHIEGFDNQRDETCRRDLLRLRDLLNTVLRDTAPPSEAAEEAGRAEEQPRAWLPSTPTEWSSAPSWYVPRAGDVVAWCHNLRTDWVVIHGDMTAGPRGLAIQSMRDGSVSQDAVRLGEVKFLRRATLDELRVLGIRHEDL